MQTTTDNGTWERLIASADISELVKRLGQIYDAIEYKKQVEQIIKGKWLSQN